MQVKFIINLILLSLFIGPISSSMYISKLQKNKVSLFDANAIYKYMMGNSPYLTIKQANEWINACNSAIKATKTISFTGIKTKADIIKQCNNLILK